MGKFLSRVKKAHGQYGEVIKALLPENMDYAAAIAVFSVESTGEPFGPYMRPIIRFEVHKFWDFCGKWNPAKFDEHFRYDKKIRWTNHFFRKFTTDPFVELHIRGPESQQREWEAFYVASGLVNGAVDAAIQATSFGFGQLLGVHYERLGYEKPTDFLEAQFSLSAQLHDFFKFIRTDVKLLAAIETKDWKTFARIYNGTGQVDTYSAWLSEAYADAVSVING